MKHLISLFLIVILLFSCTDSEMLFIPEDEPDPVLVLKQYIAYDYEQDIYITELTKEIGETVLIRLTTSGDNSEPSWSPDGSQIVYVSGDLLMIHTIGGTTESIHSGKWMNRPTFSPDGNTILFDEYPHIFTIKADGSEFTKLSDGTSSDIHPIYNADGTKIIYSTFIHDAGFITREIAIMNCDGSNKKLLTDQSDKQFLFPSIQATTGKILISIDSPYQKIATKTIVEFKYITETGARCPSYYNDGTKIIYSATVDDSPYTIWTMDTDGSNKENYGISGISPTVSCLREEIK